MENKNLVFLPDDVYKELKKIWKEFNDADDPETLAISIYALLVFLPDDVYKELKKIGKEFNDADDPETLAILIYALKSGKNSTTGTDAHSLCEYKLKAAEDLYRWAEEVLKPAADLAFAGDGNFSVIGTVHLD